MSVCDHRASLVITRAVEGTSTSVARSRTELRCELPEGHAGPHRSAARNAEWEGGPDHHPTLLRHEDEDAAQK